MIIIFCVLQSSYKAYNNQCLCSLHHTTTEEAVPFQALPSVLLWLLLNLSLGRVTSSLRHRFTAFIYNKIFKAFSIQSPLNPPLGHTNSNFTFSTFYNHFFLILNFFVILIQIRVLPSCCHNSSVSASGFEYSIIYNTLLGAPDSVSLIQEILGFLCGHAFRV